MFPFFLWLFCTQSGWQLPSPCLPWVPPWQPPKINDRGWVTPNLSSLFLSCFPAQDKGAALLGANPEGNHVPKVGTPQFLGGTPQIWGVCVCWLSSCLAKPPWSREVLDVTDFASYFMWEVGKVPQVSEIGRAHV